MALSVMQVSGLVFLLVLALSVDSEGGTVPTSPCPDVFRYVLNEDGTHYGEIVVPAKSGTLQLKMYTTDPIRNKSSRPSLRRFGGNDDNAKTWLFRVDFPYQDPLPKVDQVTVDKGVVCKGNNDPNERVTSTFQLSQSSYRSASSRTVGSKSGSGRSSHSSYSRNHTYSYNTRT